jgi:pimeloyl-ACP methyl ester carboxylesterase
MDASEASAPTARELGDIAAILLAATQPPPGGSRDLQKVWMAVQQEFADNLSAGSFKVAEGAGHYIQEDEPQLVVDAIREVTMRVK